MKFLPIIAIFIISIFLQCKQEEKVEFIPSGTMSKEDNLASALFLIDMYVYRNNCPPYTLLEPGNTTVYLKEGEEYWFDITSRLGNTKSNSEYLIKIEQSSGQKIEAKDRSCLVNGIFTASNRPIFTSNNALKSNFENILTVSWNLGNINSLNVLSIRSVSILFWVKDPL